MSPPHGPWSPRPPNPRAAWALAAALAVATLCYAPALGGFFLADDQSFLDSVAQRDREGRLGRSVLSGFVDPPDRGGNFYRPVVEASYALDYRIWGTRAFGWHLTNLVAHLGAALLLAAVLTRLLRRTEARDSWAPGVAGALFALGPLAPESVAWISGRTDPLALLAMLASLLLYLRSDRWASREGVGSLVFFALALGTKEAAATLPGWVAAIHLAGWKGGPRRLARGVLPFLGGFALYLAWRVRLFGSALEVYEGHAGVRLDDREWVESRLDTLASFLRGEVAAGPAGTAMLVGGLLLIGMGVMIARRSTASFRLMATGVLWLGVTLVPVARYLWISSTGEGARIVYIPAAALATLLAAPLAWGDAVPPVDRRIRAPVTLAVGLRLALSVVLLLGVVADWSRAGRMMEELVGAVRVEAERSPRHQRTFLLVPQRVGAAFFARNAQGALMKPPVQVPSVQDRVLVVTSWTAPVWLRGLAGLGPDFGRTEFRCWNDEDEVFVPMTLPPDAARDYQVVRRAAAKAGCRIVSGE